MRLCHIMKFDSLWNNLTLMTASSLKKDMIRVVSKQKGIAFNCLKNDGERELHLNSLLSTSNVLASGFRSASFADWRCCCVARYWADGGHDRQKLYTTWAEDRHATSLAFWIPKISRIDSKSVGEPDSVVFEIYVDTGAARKGS